MKARFHRTQCRTAVRTAFRTVLPLALPAALALAAGAGLAPAAGAESFRGVGPRFGVGTDPDQFILGLHLDAGRIAPRVRFRPDVEFGVGDQHKLVVATLPAHYLFAASGDARPYLGGGFALGLEDRDRGRPGRDDSDLEAAFLIIGGLEWATARNRSFFLELNLVAGDLHDVEVVGGLTFR